MDNHGYESFWFEKKDKRLKLPCHIVQTKIPNSIEKYSCYPLPFLSSIRIDHNLRIRLFALFVSLWCTPSDPFCGANRRAHININLYVVGKTSWTRAIASPPLIPVSGWGWSIFPPTWKIILYTILFSPTPLTVGYHYKCIYYTYVIYGVSL